MNKILKKVVINEEISIDDIILEKGDVIFVEQELSEKELLEKELWVKDVKTTGYSPPEGTFKKSADEIAKQMKADAKDYSQAVSRVNFYYNRTGEGGSSKHNAVLSALEKLYGKE